MTGFGAAEGSVGAALVSVEIRSVNHRFFNASVRLPAELSRWEHEVRETVRKKISRGHVNVSARIGRGSAAALAVDEERIGSYVVLLRALAARHGLRGEIDFATLLRLPDVLVGGEDLVGDSPVALLAVVERATDALQSARITEGAQLAKYLLERLQIVEGALRSIQARAPVRVLEHRDRLRVAVADLVNGAGVDEQRLAQEIALLAERLDIQEELSRFGAHVAAFRATLLQTSGEPVGKRLGFLLQEMLREANTTGSKANDAAMLADVVVIKEELERLREQVENLE